jgi:hypothetical protein
MRTAWVKRSPEAIFDPWKIEPTITVPGLEGLAEHIKKAHHARGPSEKTQVGVGPYVSPSEPEDMDRINRISQD